MKGTAKPVLVLMLITTGLAVLAAIFFVLKIALAGCIASVLAAVLAAITHKVDADMHNRSR